jgi:signal transduction histidine kinase
VKKTTSKSYSRLMDWFKKRMEGEKLLQWIIYIILFVVLILFTTSHSTEMPKWRFYGTILGLALLLVLNILWQNWEQNNPQALEHPLRKWTFMLISSALLLAAIWMGELYDAIFLIFMLCSQATILLGVWPAGMIFSLLNMAGMLGVFHLLGGDKASMISLAASLGIGILFVSFLTILLDQYSKQTRRAEGLLLELQTANAHLEAARQKEKELAIAEERVRLARDIHDGLGHHLTVLSIQLQAAAKLVTRNPQAANEAIQLSRVEVQAALDEVRHSVSMMRQSPADTQPLQDVLSNLVKEFGLRTGLQTVFEQAGSPGDLSSFARQTLFRIVQESLTNVFKHGKDVREIRVHFEYLPEAVLLFIRDDGLPAEADPNWQPGFGLVGLQERVDQLGGMIKSGPVKTGGFEVEVNIPLQGVAHDPGSAG